MSSATPTVFDSSAIIAFMEQEAGAERVAAYLEPDRTQSPCWISAVNYNEVLTKLMDRGAPADIIAESILQLELKVFAYDEHQAIQSAWLRPSTKKYGLSLGDRACIALAQIHKARVLTADRIWCELEIPHVIIECIRSTTKLTP
jgi:ribonuclease VapC